ncbi:hypothetical protein IU450_18585 [Nocardia abscessus]|uniref:DUF6069 family protein n=1 Tax=Nocardia abscessus TaxID=120957 RepID=UPI001892F256|nr:DUF6069 family protein [Nocardia abscessus]MBF6337885.1 hypothetical protein [Nocardia abscessus]
MSTTTAPTLRIPAVNRPVAILGSVAVSVTINLVVWLVGLAAGGSFETTDAGKTSEVTASGVIVSAAVPLLIGMTLAALLSYLWVGVLRVAQVVGATLAVATIGLTVAADFDLVSTIALSAMHVVLAPVLVGGLEMMRNRLLR